MVFTSYFCEAQLDSTIESLQGIPTKYISAIDSKIDKYSNRITSKTEKTLSKLSNWENKIKSLLEKVSPETAQRLFGNSQPTFSTILKKVKEGKALTEGYKIKYNEYRDKLTTSIKYLEDQQENLNKNLIKPVSKAKKKLKELDDDVANTEAVETFIKERKKLLIDEAVKYLGKNKYLTKIDKEAYYYVETLRNYKELFSDKKKAEELATKILNKIPAFKNFTQKNSMLASLFPGGTANPASSTASLAGLQTRSNVNALIQQQIAAGGPNAREQISQNLQAAQAELAGLKDKVLKAGGNSSDMEIPDFKPNQQKTKTFFQRLEFSSDIQYAKNNSFVPSTADIALSLGYKLNDKSLIGLGASYRLGFGSIEHLSFSHQGIGIRSFIDWKLKKQFFISGGYEVNYNATFKNITQLRSYNDWQQSGLVGVTKKINIKTKFVKGAKIQIMYNMLAGTHIPSSRPFVFRTGYTF